MPNRRRDYHLKKIKFSACVPRWVLEEFTKIAAENGFTRSEIITDLMKSFVQQWKPTEKK